MRKYKKGEKSPLFKDLRNKKFGKLIAKEYISHTTKKGNIVNKWRCVCDCGNETLVRTNELTKGKRTMCAKCSKQIISAQRVKPNHEALINRIIKQYRNGAKNRGYEFKLSNEDVKSLIKQNCYYCGDEPSIHDGEIRHNHTSEDFKRNGIDRIDNKKGYTIDNVVPCCSTCNKAKMTLSQDEFFTLINKISKNLEKRSTTIPRGSTEQANGSGNGFDPKL